MCACSCYESRNTIVPFHLLVGVPPLQTSCLDFTTTTRARPTQTPNQDETRIQALKSGNLTTYHRVRHSNWGSPPNHRTINDHTGHGPPGAVYPTAYARTVLQLLDGLSRAESIPQLVTLELCHCPFDHMSEADLPIDKALCLQAMKKVKVLKVVPLGRSSAAYVVPRQRRNTEVRLIEVFRDAPHLEDLYFSTDRDKLCKNFIISATQFQHLAQVEFGPLPCSSAPSSPRNTNWKCLPFLKGTSLCLGLGKKSFRSGCGGSQRCVLDGSR
jgi:hypothetical protein